MVPVDSLARTLTVWPGVGLRVVRATGAKVGPEQSDNGCVIDPIRREVRHGAPVSIGGWRSPGNIQDTSLGEERNATIVPTRGPNPTSHLRKGRAVSLLLSLRHGSTHQRYRRQLSARKRRLRSAGSAEETRVAGWKPRGKAARVENRLNTSLRTEVSDRVSQIAQLCNGFHGPRGISRRVRRS